MTDEVEQDESSVAGNVGKLLAVIVGFLLMLAALSVFALIFGAIGWAAVEVVFHHDRAFRIVGENVVQWGAWVAAVVAAGSVTVLALTNRSRAREAVNNDFRDFIQWALENLNQDDDTASRLFAFRVVTQFAEEPPKLLDERNKMLAKAVLLDVAAENFPGSVDVDQSMTDDKETPNVQEEGGEREQECHSEADQGQEIRGNSSPG